MTSYSFADMVVVPFPFSEPFDYTQWRQNLEVEDSIEDISRKAMGLRDSQELKTHTEI